ncbi:DEAD/DEAH box helicase [Pedobacter sp. SYSU D00535]|uniref:DEAD/DEAH box helicase n=1 Tax=Pedobacter sp. SYSU D00535 TaxID=2810308 RepID=UPI001A976D4D|nr:DEAD/DEAH box helicase family protein [Pedobacter sp. SYSU D00535]
MISLFPEEKFVVKFECSKVIPVHGNKIEYHVGTEKGILRKYTASDYSGFEFFSDNGSKYFISTVKSSIPNGYDAAFFVDTTKYDKLTYSVLAKCSKKAVYINIPKSSEVETSWENAFKYKKETRSKDKSSILQKGLRPPQLGALHAIQAHWSISSKPAVVVMPTGTGKTETMLCLTVAEKLTGLLVIVPTASLRTQIFDKFKTLGILKQPDTEIISFEAKAPLVGHLNTKIKSDEDADQIFKSNVIVSTPQIITGILKGPSKIKSKFLQWLKVLTMDEAHHSQAQEWNKIKQNVEILELPVLLFTATPFRNDKKRLQGEIIYNYPLSLAQRDGYYKNINFHHILDFNPETADKAIAQKAIDILIKDRKVYDHILMARVDLKERAQIVFDDIYSKYTEFNPILIDSDTPDKKALLEDIKKGLHKIIVCVDMLGEGFDLPQLKICALHDLHKNITTSFQFFGRFTRDSSLRLGEASIVANIADPNLKGTLNKLYQKDSDWNTIIKSSNEEIIESIVKEENFFKNFSQAEIPNKIPLRNIMPAMSTVVFQLHDSKIEWNPNKYKKLFDKDKYEAVSVEHEEEKLLIIIVKQIESVKWGKIDDLLNCAYHLYIVYLNEEQKLLYINSSNNGSIHRELGELVVGENISLFNESKIYRCLGNIFQIELFNLGLKSVLDGPISFTMYAGNGIVNGLDELDNKTKSSSNLFGVGYEDGEKISIGCSSKGRVWTKLVKSIPDFCTWCDLLGLKLLDESINTDDIFSFIQKPEVITTLPIDLVPVSISWNEELYAYPNLALYRNIPIVDYGISLVSFDASILNFSIQIDELRIEYRLHLIDEGRGFKYELKSTIPLYITQGGDLKLLEEVFYEYPPIIRFHDNSKMHNNILLRFKGDYDIFDVNNIIPYDWKGVNIQQESQKEEKRLNSIQYFILLQLKSDEDCKIVFDDDSANEASDIVAIKYWADADYKIDVSLYHCKFSSKPQSGARLKDIYEVNGQAQRSFHWRHQSIELLNHMIRRENLRINQGRNSRFEKGTKDDIKLLLSMLSTGYCRINFNIYVVQPGLSRELLINEPEHLKLLGATDLLLKKTGNNFYIITDK